MKKKSKTSHIENARKGGKTTLKRKGRKFFSEIASKRWLKIRPKGEIIKNGKRYKEVVDNSVA